MQLAPSGAPPCPVEPAIGPLESGSSPVARPEHIVETAAAFWQRLVASNATLYCILLAVNAWALPYTGLVHDARLYAIQLINRLDGGSFSGDLYLQFGSQDRFTLFSPVTAPLVQILGLQTAFLLIYLVSVAVFLWGLQKMVLALCENRTLASLVLIFLATTHITFAGLETFYVNENFVTPRLLANGLTLWALALLLEKRTKTAFLLIAFALILHPLMACGGLLVCVAYVSASRFTKWHAWALGAIFLATCGLFCSETLPGRILGHMDANWMDAARRANPYNFPSEWAGQDWFHVLIALGIVLAACSGLLRRTERGRLMACIAVVGAAGLLVNVVAVQLPYALPVQGQGYRWLWLLQFLQIPLGFLLIHLWWQQGALSSRIAATIVAAYLGSRMGDRQQFLALLVSFGAFAYFLSTCRDYVPSIKGMVAFVAGLGWLCFYESISLHNYWVTSAPQLDTIELIRNSPTGLFAFTRLALAVLFVLALTWLCRLPQASRWVLIGGAIVLQVGNFAASAESRLPTPGVSMLRDYLKEHDSPRHPTVYWPVGWVNYLWFDLGVDSYFEQMQISGNIFSRQTAMEGERRMQLVKRFELERIRNSKKIYSPLQLDQIEALFRAKLTEPEPTWNDVKALCADPRVDYLVLLQDFPGRSVANDGRWYLYDCQAIRSAGVSNSPSLQPDAKGHQP